MHCIQDTITGLTILTWPDTAPDEAMTRVGPILSVRLHIAAGGTRQCCGAAIDLVAVNPDDPTLPHRTRTALHTLRPGLAVADSSLPELAGGWVALPGVDVRIGAATDLGGSAIALAFDDAAALLRADTDHRLDVRTTAIVACTPDPVPEGWHPEHIHGDVVPLTSSRTSHSKACEA